jgi:di/tricarboxylate transporter
MVIFMRVLKDPNNPYQLLGELANDLFFAFFFISTASMSPSDASDAANYVTSTIFNHTTFLLLGGYTISTAFSRCQLELRLASLLQTYLGEI